MSRKSFQLHMSYGTMYTHVYTYSSDSRFDVPEHQYLVYIISSTGIVAEGENSLALELEQLWSVQQALRVYGSPATLI